MGRLVHAALVVAVWLGVVVRVAHAAPADELGWTLLDQRMPDEACAGQTLSVAVRVRNSGETTWSPAERDRLSYHWLDAAGATVQWDGRRTELPREVSTGDVVALTAEVELPEQPGAYQLVWEMVRENVKWYGAASSPVAVEVGPPAFRWTLIDADVPDAIAARGQGEARVRVRNDGCLTWSADDGDRLAYHWLGLDGSMVELDGVRTAVPDLAPGESADVRATLRGPPRPGRYRLQWDMVREHVTWYGNGATVGPIDGTTATLAWDLVEHDTPTRIHARDVFEARVRLRNTGLEPWSEANADRFSYRWLGDDGRQVGEGVRTSFPGTVAPGEEVELTARVVAPKAPGRYRLAWEPVREHVTWLGPPKRGTAAREVDVEVDVPKLAWALEHADVPGTLWVNRTHLVPVRVRNAGAVTWSRETSDNLSYHWRAADGTMIDREGLRTRVPGPVEPGESVDMMLRVRGPRHAGDYVLEIEMVREHVSWHGPPRGEVGARFDVRGRWASSALGLGLVLLSAFLAIGVRRLPRPGGPWLRAFRDGTPLVWTAAALLVLVVVFAELSGFELWEDALRYSGSGAVLLAAPLLVVPGRARPWVGFALVAGLSVLVLSDLAYMQFFGSIVPLEALAASHQLFSTGASIASLMQPEFAWLVTVPLAGLVVAIAWPRDAGTARRGRMKAVAALVVLLAAAPALTRLYTATTGDLGRRVFSDQNNVGRLGVLNTHLFELTRAAYERTRLGTLDDDSRARIARFFAARAEDAQVQSELAGAARGKSLVVIQVEALQEWVIGAQVGEQPITPYLNGLRERALYYPHVFDQTSHGRTSDAEYLVLDSQHPLAHGALCFLRDGNDFHTIAHVLQDHGYGTLSAHPYKRGFWNRAILHPRYGFARSMFRRELGDGTNVGWGLADGLFFERMLPELEALERPFFAFLITLSLHHPYEDFPEQLSELELGELEGTNLGNYLQAMRYFDRSLAAFMDGLEARGLADDVLIAIYGDHDARFGEPPEVLALAGLERWDPSTPARLERVPLFVVGAGEGASGEVRTIGGQIDIGTTLLHFLGIPRPASFVGKPLVPGGRGHAALPDGSGVERDRIYVATGRDIPPGGACFDFPQGTRRPRKDCDGLADRVGEELEVSRLVLDHDLYGELAGTEPRE